MARRKGKVVTDTIDVREAASSGGGPSGPRPVDELAAELLARADSEGVSLVGPGGLLAGLTKQVLETALEAEMTEHLGYEPHDPAGHHSGDSRNGTRPKTVLTEIGPVELEEPRDRDASFEPQIVPKRRRRLSGVDEMVCALSARGLTHGEICAYLAEVYADRAGVSPAAVIRAALDVLAENGRAAATIRRHIQPIEVGGTRPGAGRPRKVGCQPHQLGMIDSR